MHRSIRRSDRSYQGPRDLTWCELTQIGSPVDDFDDHQARFVCGLIPKQLRSTDLRSGRCE
jgi:hypothetical protein